MVTLLFTLPFQTRLELHLALREVQMMLRQF